MKKSYLSETVRSLAARAIAARTLALLFPVMATLLATQLQAAGPISIGPERKAAIDAITAAIKEAGQYPSITVLVDQGGKTLYSNYSGMANIEQNIPAGADSVYSIGSITKSFTALATLQLVEAGKVDLEQSVRTYLPDYSGPGGDVAVKHLLVHTSGIPNYTNDIPGLHAKLDRTDFSREEMVGFFSDLPLQFEPGSMFNYTNSGYYLLGLIIEKVSGLDYYDYLRQNIFQPLQMDHSYSGNSSEIIAGRVSGYAADEKGLVNAPPWWYLIPFSAGSLAMTAQDVVKYRRGVFTSPAFSPKLRELLLTTQTMKDGTHNFYAQGGLILSEVNGHRKISHSGDIWGFAADHAYYPDDDVTIVVLSNRQADAPSVVSLEQKIAREVFGIAQPEILDLPVSAEDIARFAGNYKLHPFIFGPPVYGFVGQDGKLFLKFGGVEQEGPMIPLLSQGDGRFLFAPDDEWSFEFNLEGAKSQSFESSTRDGRFYAGRTD
jgi:D-alanyl-D-alanine carboxypeptidase